MSVEANIVRIEVDQGDAYRAPSSKVTGDVIRLPRSRDIAIQIGIKANGIFMADASYIATITAEVRNYATPGDAAIVIAATSTIAAIAEAQWEDNTAQHATVTLPAAQTAGISVGSKETAYWLVITAVTAGGKPLTLIAGKVLGVDDAGNYSATAPTPADPSFVTSVAFYSALAAINQGVIEENGFRGRWGIDENGVPKWRLLT